MGFPSKTFKGQLKDKNIYTYLTQLDYTIPTTDGRMKKLNEILSDSDNFFVEYFSGENSQGEKWFDSNPNSTDLLSHENNICLALERMADYLLFAPDKPKDKDLKYVFVTKEELWNNEYVEVPINFNDTSDTDDNSENPTNKDTKNHINENNLMYFIRPDSNYYLENTQKIFKNDYNDLEIGEKLKEIHKNIEKVRKLREKNPKRRKNYNTLIKNYNKDMIDYKNGIKKPIVLKHISKGTTEINWSFCDYSNPEHIFELLRCTNKNLLTGTGELVYDLEQLIDKTKLNLFEQEFLKQWRSTPWTQEQFGKKFKVTQQFIGDTLRGICLKICNKYMDDCIDWFNLNWVKGVYKKCGRCQETKLVRYFGKDGRSKDGFYSCCKNCR